MPSSIQALVSEAMREMGDLKNLDDHELLATEWLWALRDSAVALCDLTDEQLQPLLIEDLLTIARFEGQGRNVAQTADGMMRFLDRHGRARVIQACFEDERVKAMLLTDGNNRIRLDPCRIPAAMIFAGIQ